jgi:hypothetical protein
MKKIVAFTMLIAMSINSFSQQTDTLNSLTKADYLKKSKGQKTAAWVLVGAGVTCFAIAAPGDVSFETAGTLVVVGGLAIVGSIPLFIASAKNKKKARSISTGFKMENAPSIQRASLVNRSYPAVSIKLSL